MNARRATRQLVVAALVAGGGGFCGGAAAAGSLSSSEIQEVFPDVAVQPYANGRYSEIIQAAVEHIGGDGRLIEAVIYAESRGNPSAVSGQGAIGLMQLIPGAGAAEGYRALYRGTGTPSSEALKDPHLNIWLGVQYLALLRDEYLSHIPSQARRPIVLAAYNWGIGRVLKRLPPGLRTKQDALEWINHTCPDETIGYVDTVLSRYDDHSPRTLALR